MSFDRPTRNLLARMVGQVRERLRADVADQLRRLGFQDDGTVLDLDRIAGLTEADLAATRELRALVEHFTAAESGGDPARRRAAYDRMVHEIGFTTFNRLVALRMAEERGLVIEAVRKGLASDGFQVFEAVARGALGARAQTYRAYLECLYDELAQDLPLLFDRRTPESRIFPSERCLEDILVLLNDSALTHLWAADEAIGWVYQYYNDPEERKRMRESGAPRTSRELAVRNQFFTPRYVVEFLTDNTLGRLWYEMRQGDTVLKEECRYRPNLDDGVIINAAPLHKLFRLPKWANDTRDTWQKLERGEDDWAHLAFTIWPERVREKCRDDRSLAIAHDLEDLYAPPATEPRRRRPRAACGRR